jgi:hypothetical protein
MTIFMCAYCHNVVLFSHNVVLSSSSGLEHRCVTSIHCCAKYILTHCCAELARHRLVGHRLVGPECKCHVRASCAKVTYGADLGECKFQPNGLELEGFPPPDCREGSSSVYQRAGGMVEQGAGVD